MDREELSKALNETVAGMPVVTGKTDATEKDDKPDFIGDDGLLHCGKCGKPKQMRLETPMRDTPFVVGIRCECEQRETEEREKREQREAAKAKAQAARAECFKGCELLRDCTFEQDDRKNPLLSDACLRFAETFDRKDRYGLLLWGNVGTGKSFMSAAIANRVIERGFTALQTDIGSIVTTRESSFDDRKRNLDRLMGYDLLLIDDLGAQRSTDYMMEQVYAVIDGRYRAGKPMVISTNMDAEQIATRRDNGQWGRVIDRILEVCYPLEFKGKSRRRTNAVAMRGTMKKRLGL